MLEPTPVFNSRDATVQPAGTTGRLSAGQVTWICQVALAWLPVFWLKPERGRVFFLAPSAARKRNPKFGRGGSARLFNAALGDGCLAIHSAFFSFWVGCAVVPTSFEGAAAARRPVTITGTFSSFCAECGDYPNRRVAFCKEGTAAAASDSIRFPRVVRVFVPTSFEGAVAVGCLFTTTASSWSSRARRGFFRRLACQHHRHRFRGLWLDPFAPV